MFVHYKGAQDNPRTDKYLFGMSTSIIVFYWTLRLLLSKVRHS